MGREADVIAFGAALAAAPYRYDFYQTLRRLECLAEPRPRWGEARRPLDEPIRLGQEADLSFAPAPIASFGPGRKGMPPRLHVRLFGLLGPNGPLPLHLTERARERQLHAADQTLSRFLDLFNHRFLALLYRAWAQAQPHVNHDRPAEDRFRVFIGSFVGIAPASMRRRDSTPDLAKLFHAGALLRQTRNADGLKGILEHFFNVPVALQQFVGHWLELGARERTCLAEGQAVLGAGAVLGRRVWDRQHKFRIQLGPLTLDQYEAFLPGGALLPQMADWVRLYCGFELAWDVRLVLAEGQVPRLRLGSGSRLGWTSWLPGRRAERSDRDDLCLDAESFRKSRNPPSAVPRPLLELATL
jgi:type VI secretion system protein ImpH